MSKFRHQEYPSRPSRERRSSVGGLQLSSEVSLSKLQMWVQSGKLPSDLAEKVK